MRVISTLLLLVMAMLLATSCSSVSTSFPLSDDPKPIDQKEFEGAWLVDEEVFHVRFDSNGVAQTAVVEWKSNEFHIVRGEMTVAEGEENNFLSIRFQEDGKWTNNYFFLSYTFTEDHDLILWAPDVEAFEELLEKKELQGIVEKDQYSTSITITNEPALFLKCINDPDNLKLFQYRDPLILKKLSGKKK